MARRVHQRPNQVINSGVTKTACGRAIHALGADTTAAVTDFGGFDATIHAALVTCSKCLGAARASVSGEQ